VTPGTGGIAAVIVAAGAGTRLGGVAKALLRRGGASYLEAIATTARAVGLADAVVVVGEPFGREVAAHAGGLALRVCVNPAPQRGMASSVALGFDALGAAVELDAAWLWPVDHPAVTVSTLRRLIDALARADGDVAQPCHAGRGGHPPLIRRALWPRLAACAGEPDGARGVLRAARRIAVEVDDPGVVRDVDAPTDLEVIA
jgi:molybdenum cofactor cytidylyltransferase